jgi:hypothetical protein
MGEGSTKGMRDKEVVMREDFKGVSGTYSSSS